MYSQPLERAVSAKSADEDEEEEAAAEEAIALLGRLTGVIVKSGMTDYCSRLTIEKGQDTSWWGWRGLTDTSKRFANDGRRGRRDGGGKERWNGKREEVGERKGVSTTI